MRLQEDLQAGSSPGLDLDSVTRTRLEAVSMASCRGLLEGQPQNQIPPAPPALATDPDPDLVLGVRPGEAKTWRSQLEGGTGQPLSVEPWTSQPSVEPLQAHKD